MEVAPRGKAPPVTGSEVDQMAVLYSEGLSSNDIGKRLGRTGRTVRTHLRSRGLMRGQAQALRLAVERGKIRKRSLREDFFEVLTPASVWLLGLLYGDGHVQIIPGRQYGVTLAGSQEVCQKSLLLLGSDASLVKCSQNGWRWTVYSKALVGSLARWGLTGGNKALSMRYPSDIPPWVEGHFIRGLWDADGGWRLRGKSLDASYVSHSEGFIQDLQERVGGKIHVQVHKKVKPGAVGYTLRLRVGETASLVRRIYADAPAPIRCDRKYRLAAGRGGGQ